LSTLGIHYAVSVNVIHNSTFLLSYNSSEIQLATVLGRLPIIKSPFNVRTSSLDLQNGKNWSLSYSGNTGAVPNLICNVEAFWTAGVCDVEVVVSGNRIGGYFKINDSPALASDIDASGLQTALENLNGIGLVNVTKSLDDGYGGYSWTIVFKTGGRIPLLVLDGSGLTGVSASISIREVIAGNQVGGNFSLSFGGYSTSLIFYNTPAAVSDSKGDGTSLQEILEKLPSIGQVKVSKLSSDTENGVVWYVTFIDDIENLGDLPLMTVSKNSLTGVGAVLYLKEVVKGSRATSDMIALSWTPPQWCSTSQVSLGHCGDPLTEILIEWDILSDFKTSGQRVSHIIDDPAVFYQVQIVHTTGDAEVTGTFQLSYNGELSSEINAGVSAAEMRYILEELPSITTLQVSRDYSRLETGILIDAVNGQTVVNCSVSVCDFASQGIQPCSLIQIQSTWYRVRDNWNATTSTLALASEMDCSTSTWFIGQTELAIPLYRWGNGFAWSITFVDAPVSSLVPLQSPLTDLYPYESAVLYVSSEPCNKCYYIPTGTSLQALTLGQNYFINAWPYNNYGTHGASQVLTQHLIALRIPDQPTDISVQVISGSSIQVFFCPPTLFNTPTTMVSSYNVQWDIWSNFSHAQSTGCVAGNYGDCSVSGTAIQGACPFSFMTEGLREGTYYYFRVAARNDVPAQHTSPNPNPKDNTQWSITLGARAQSTIPEPPTELTLFTMNGTVLQVQISIPALNSQKNISHYLVYYASNSLFYNEVELRVPASNLPVLYPNGPLVYNINGLSVGVYYYVRCRILSNIGMSNFTEASNQPRAPQQLSYEPQNVQLSASTIHTNQDITNLTVSWESPVSDGGTEIIGYRIEYWQTHSYVDEIQRIDLEWNAPPPTGSLSTWFFAFRGVKSSAVNPQVTNIDLRDVLMNMHKESDFPIGYITVTRRVNTNILRGYTGYSYSITFTDVSTNPGNEPAIQATLQFTTPAVAVCSEVQAGVRPGGISEVQVIESIGTGSGTRGALNPDNAIVRGWWRIRFQGSSFSNFLSSEASAGDVEGAVESLVTVGDVKVSRNLGTTNGYQWSITFTTPVGNLEVVQVDTTFLWTTNSDAVLVLHDGDNAVDPNVYYNAALTCPGCQIGETPVGYSYLDVDADVREITLTGLVAGMEYTVAVSALNKFGQGVRAYSAEQSYPLPIFQPSPPINASLAVKTWLNSANDTLGDRHRLIFSYQPPYSTGGVPITSYYIELDLNVWFKNPVNQTFRCPNGPDKAIWTVATQVNHSCMISGGYFTLTLLRAGNPVTTDPIPYNALALSKEEQHADFITNSTVQCTNNNNDNDYNCPSARLQSSGSMQSKINAIGTLAKGVNVTKRSLGRGQYIWSITFLDLYDDFLLTVADASHFKTNPSSCASLVNLNVQKRQAGKVYGYPASGSCYGAMVVPTQPVLLTGRAYYARVFAYNQVGFSEPQVALVPQIPSIVPNHSTAVFLKNFGPNSLEIEIFDVSDTGGLPVDYFLIEYSTNKTFFNASRVNLTVLTGGEPYFKAIYGLVNGNSYYVRVRGHNARGLGAFAYSVPTSLYPYQQPGQPRNVVLKVTSVKELTLGWASPLSNGGDPLTTYIVELSTSLSFSSSSTTSIQIAPSLLYYTFMSTAASQSFSLTTSYYARVTAVNRAGSGIPQSSTPTNVVIGSYSSRCVAGKPTNARAVFNSVLQTVTIAWGVPMIPYHGVPCNGNTSVILPCPADGTAKGGNSILNYIIDYSKNRLFAAFATYSTVLIPASNTSYTFKNLTANNTYFFRIKAKTSLGTGIACNQTGAYCSSGNPLFVKI